MPRAACRRTFISVTFPVTRSFTKCCSKKRGHRIELPQKLPVPEPAGGASVKMRKLFSTSLSRGARSDIRAAHMNRPLIVTNPCLYGPGKPSTSMPLIAAPPCTVGKTFEQARTHDPLWNAAQTQLLRDGCVHNYLRMLWGKKILEWSASPQEALDIMIHLNNRYALDGRNPNSYSGILWVLGKYDRPWGPERPVFGKIRYMSSQNTARKVRLKKYLNTFSS